ncbi:MAG: hypothetical protein KBC84_06275 [Proteobacteria bacterium]|nr:hypothetical protein [Pseudomonadota bacterium]
MKKNGKKQMSKIKVTLGALLAVSLMQAATSQDAFARDSKYLGGEQTVYVNPGEPTQVLFPGKIQGGFKPKNASFAVEKKENFLVVFSQPELQEQGEAMLVILDDKRSYALRIMPADEDHTRDEILRIQDERENTDVENGPSTPDIVPRAGYSPPSIPSGLIREMVLTAEMGKQKGIPGYKRSNKYSGETVLHDGAVEAKIEEIFMGSDLWGYVLSVENLLDTNQKINPATFRLDGTRAVSAENWELAARPQTAEQQLSGKHKAKVYIVTRALSH